MAKTNLVCETCGQGFYRPPSYIRAKNPRFCSHECRNRGYYELGISSRRRQLGIKDDFFNSWSNDMAYALGLTCADGHVCDKRQSYLELSSKDPRLPTIIRDLVAPSVPVKRYERDLSQYSQFKSKTQISYVVRISSPLIVRRLRELGLSTTKSYDLRMPFVPNQYFAPFVRGIFDGDGSVTMLAPNRARDGDRAKSLSLRATYSGTESFIASLAWRLHDLASVSAQKPNRFGESACWRVCYSAARDSIALFRYMYQPNPEDPSSIPHLSRKWQGFMDFRPYALERGWWIA